MSRTNRLMRSSPEHMPAVEAASGLQCVTGYPCFYPAGFAIAIVVPVINVHQADHWQINGQQWPGWMRVAGSWTATALGWLMATLLVVRYTGLAKHE